MMSGRCLAVLALVLTPALPLTGCGEPIHFGLAQARAAGIDVPAGGSFFWPMYVPRTAGRPEATGSSGEVVTLPEVPRPHRPEDVVGVRLEHDGSAAPSPVTFGQVFIPGQVAAGQTVVAYLNGRPVPTQVDVKTTNQDGSARMAVVTVLSGAPADLMLVRRAAGGTRPPVDLGKAAASLDLAVEMTMHGGSGDTVRRFAIGPLLSAALRQGQASYWLRGPLATEARVQVPAVGSMRLTTDVRAYAGGAIMADLQFNNDIAMRPEGGTLTYDVTIRLAGRPVWQRVGIEQFQYQTWHRQIWTKREPEVNVVHDVPALARAGAIQNYDVSTGVLRGLIDDEIKAMDGPGYDILGNAGVAKGMGMTGGRPDIGPVTLANTLWLMTQDADAARFALAQADAAGSVPWHFFDSATGTYVSVETYPKLWADGRGGRWDTKGLTQPVGAASGWQPDNAHQPDLSYVPYILTGLRYRLDQVQAQASGTILMVWPTSRGDDQAIVTSANEQVRARGWALRGVNEASFVCPDGAPLCGYFADSVRNSVDSMLVEARGSTNGAAWGWFKFAGPDGITNPEGGVTSPWMQDFVANTLILMAQQGVPGAAELVRWQSHFLAGRFLAEEQGFHPNNATAYRINLFARNQDEPFQTWREIEAATIAHGFAKDGSVWANTIAEYTRAAQGVLGGIVSATGSPDAERALAWMLANAPHAGRDDLRRDPSFNIVPLPPSDRRQPSAPPP